MPKRYECNGCADTENILAPCKFELPDVLDNVDVLLCPLNGEECDWLLVEDKKGGE